MDHARALRAILAVTALFLAALVVWAVVVRPLSPPGTVPVEVVMLVAGYAFLLGLGLLWAQRGSRADRRLLRRGYEGWATILSVRPLQNPQRTGALSEIRLRVVVPGALPYAGTLVRPLGPRERTVFRPGETLPVRVDPRDRDHVLVRPQVMPH